MKDRLLLPFLIALITLLFTCACQRKPVPKAFEGSNLPEIFEWNENFAAV